MKHLSMLRFQIFFNLIYLFLYLERSVCHLRHQNQALVLFSFKNFNAQSPKNPIFRQFLAQICPQNFFFKNWAPSHFGHCHFASLCQKSEKTNEPISRKAENRKMVKGNFPKKRKSVFCNEKKLSGKNCFGHILWYLALYLSAKNQKKLMKQFCTKSKKPYFQAVFGPNLPQKFFFQKLGSVTFWALPFCIFMPKFRKN